MKAALESLTSGDTGSVKTVLASVVLALAAYQVLLAAIGYRRLPIIAARPAFFTHRALGDTIVVLVAFIALACVTVYGLDDDYVLHGVVGAGAVAVFAVKIFVVRSGRFGGALPYLGSTLFVLLALTWLTAAPEFLS